MSIPSSPSREESSLYKSALENLTFSSLNESDFGSETLENSSDLKDSTLSLIMSESSDNVEVDPKSKLANKTIFKTDNPNLSIIEIHSSNSKDEDDAVYLIESDSEDPPDGYSNQPKYDLDCDNVGVPILMPTTSTSNENDETMPKDTKRVIKIYDTVDEFEQNLPDTVTVLTTPFGSKVYLVGTAHFSEDSQDDVSFVIRNVQPDIVMVELCHSRIHILKLDEKTLLEEAKNVNLAKIRNIINTNGVVNGIFYLILLRTSAQMAKELGMAPGGEFRRAFSEMLKLRGCLLQLGDRPINITLQRALRSLTFWQTIKLMWRLTASENISVEEIEDCKQRDLLQKIMKELTGEFPAFSDVFVRERDIYICHSLQVAAMPHTQPDGTQRPVKVVGVIGIGHLAGIVNNWGKVDSATIPEILQIPPWSTSTKVLKYTIKYGFYGLLAYGAFRFLRPKLRGIF